MKMYDLTQGTESDVMVDPALDTVTSGPYWTTDFPAADGSFVMIFWTTDSEGNVAVVLEHTMGVLTPLYATCEVRYFAPLPSK